VSGREGGRFAKKRKPTTEEKKKGKETKTPIQKKLNRYSFTGTERQGVKKKKGLGQFERTYAGNQKKEIKGLVGVKAKLEEGTQVCWSPAAGRQSKRRSGAVESTVRQKGEDEVQR